MPVQVICLGAVNADLRYEVADLGPFREAWPRLERSGEAALSPGEEARLRELLGRYGKLSGKWGGGQAANTAYALARLGVEAALIGRVGADEDGAFLREGLEGVNLNYLVEAGISGRAYVLVDPEGERTILVAPNTNDALREADIPREAPGSTQYLHLTSFVGPGPLRLQKQLAGRLYGTALISLDPGELYARRGRESLEDLLDCTDILMVTERELGLLGGDPASYPDWGPPLILVKRGARGARMVTPVGILDFPADTPSRLVDTLGAGDVFAAGFLAGRLNGLNLPNAMRLAVRAAAHSLAGAGREHYPDREFLETQLADLS
jgi:ribokinase